MSEFLDQYYPTLCIRRAEMKAMEKLPPAEKARMLPIVLLAPWLNSIKFENTFQRIDVSLGSIPMIVDLDRHYRSSSEHESRQYFKSLLAGEGAADRWIELISEHENFIPVVQTFDQSDIKIEEQIGAFREMGRGLAFRFEIGSGMGSSYIEKHIPSLDLDSTLFILDGGWREYSLEGQALLEGYIDALTNISEAVKIVVCTSNFPNSFSDLNDMAAVNISSRQYYSEIRKKYGNYQIFYGDWASTKPRRYDGGGSKPLARIDYPQKDRWVISRSKEEEWDFVEAAKRIARLPEWEDRPAVWGVSMIEKTAANLPGAIATGPQAIAARVNIHLFLQNNFQVENVASIPTDSPWIDPI